MNMKNCDNCGQLSKNYSRCDSCNFIICFTCNESNFGKIVVHKHFIGWFCSENCILLMPQHISAYQNANYLIKQQQTIQNQIEKNNIIPLLRQHIINDLLNIINEYIFTE